MIPSHNILFDDATHTYIVDGVIRPSVTTILKEFGLYPDYLPDVRYMARGTLVHCITELYDKGELDDSDAAWDAYDEAQDDPFWRIGSYFKAYRQFSLDTKPTWTGIEHRLFSPSLNVCGTADRIGVTKNGTPFILDLKATNGTPAKCTALQTALYAVMHSPSNYQSYLRFALRVPTSGPARITEYTDSGDFSAAMGAAYLYHWKKGARL